MLRLSHPVYPSALDVFPRATAGRHPDAASQTAGLAALSETSIEVVSFSFHMGRLRFRVQG